MDLDEHATLSEVRRLTFARETASVVSLLKPHLDGITGGAMSRAFSGVAFDAYCRSLLASRGHTEAVRQEIGTLIERVRTRSGDQPWARLYDGCLLHLEGKDDEASEHYAVAAREAEVLWPSSVGCRSVIGPLQREAYLRAPLRQGELLWEKTFPDPTSVLLVACDPLYLRRFAPAYLRSVRNHGRRCVLHIHIINAAPDDLGWIKEQADDLWPRIAVSTEVHSGPDARAYFALARMLRLAEFLETYRVPILATDIDAMFTGDVEASLEAASDAGIGLRFKRQDYHAHPWNSIQAGAILTPPTEQGFAFATALASISAGLFADRAGSGIWFIDQNVLFSAFRRFEGAMTFTNLNGSLPGGLRFGKDL